MQIGIDDTIRRGEGHVEADVLDEVVMMSIEKGFYYSMEDSAQVIWKMIDGTMTVRDLLTSVSRHYEIEAAQCEADVFSFLQQLAEQELIEKVAVKPN